MGDRRTGATGGVDLGTVIPMVGGVELGAWTRAVPGDGAGAPLVSAHPVDTAAQHPASNTTRQAPTATTVDADLVSADPFNRARRGIEAMIRMEKAPPIRPAGNSPA
jgi:hypothetical protein